MAAANERVFAFGGYVEGNGGQWNASREIYALRTNTRTIERFGTRWIGQNAMPAPQSECVALEHRGMIHLITGRTPRGEANAQWSDQIDTDAHRVFDPDHGRWTTARPAPAPRNSAAGAVIRNQLYLVGGRTVGGGNLTGWTGMTRAPTGGRRSAPCRRRQAGWRQPRSAASSTPLAGSGSDPTGAAAFMARSGSMIRPATAGAP
jgi:hypothetical protein